MCCKWACMCECVCVMRSRKKIHLRTHKRTFYYVVGAGFVFSFFFFCSPCLPLPNIFWQLIIRDFVEWRRDGEWHGVFRKSAPCLVCVAVCVGQCDLFYNSCVCVCVLAINGSKMLHRQQLRFLLNKIVVIVIVIAFVNAVVVVATGIKCIDLPCVLAYEKLAPLIAKVCYDFA